MTVVLVVLAWIGAASVLVAAGAWLMAWNAVHWPEWDLPADTVSRRVLDASNGIERGRP